MHIDYPLGGTSSKINTTKWPFTDSRKVAYLDDESCNNNETKIKT